MIFPIRCCISVFLVISLAVPSLLYAADPETSRIGQELQVFPGDKFYVQGERIDVPVLELSDTFESRMPGAMRIRFNFAIGTRQLHWVRDRGEWSYFAASPGKARAWHAWVGDVLADGDTVGVRIHKRTGAREWFVDNSIHNRQLSIEKRIPGPEVTIWSRPIEPKDVSVSVAGVEQVSTDRQRIRGLEYLGIRDEQLRIRYTEAGDTLREEEFLFPVTEMPMLIGVMGLRAEVHAIDGASARLKVLRGFEGDGFAKPAP